MNKSNRYSPKVRECAERMIQEACKNYSSQWAAVESIAPKIGCAAVTLHDKVKKREIDAGRCDSGTISDRGGNLRVQDGRQISVFDKMGYELVDNSPAAN